ncbi:MAG: hypothetical protein L3J63_11670 [Geopsychrobacter sp.]|nr:hypothetical protein [Geopsychrobacter sp.]
MKKRYWFLLLIAVIGLSLFSYNYWSYSCGRCNAESLLTLSLPAELLIGINLLALMGLLYVRARKQKKIDPFHCRCGALLVLNWKFCPSCGQACLKSI